MCETAHNFKYYGGRGIKICAEWQDFTVFRAWATENGYVDGLTIERTDVDGDYSPDNCRWLPQNQQSKNRRNVRPVVRSDGEYFNSASDAERSLGRSNKSSCILLAVKGRNNHSGGYSWRYATPEEIAQNRQKDKAA